MKQKKQIFALWCEVHTYVANMFPEVQSMIKDFGMCEVI